MNNQTGVLGMTKPQTMLASFGVLALLGTGIAFWLMKGRKKPDTTSTTKKEQKAAESAVNSQPAPSKTNASRGVAETLVDPSESDPLSTSYYTIAKKWAKHFHKRGIHRLSPDKALKISTKIERSWGRFGNLFDDQEEDIYEAFKSIPSKSDVSLVAAAYPSVADGTPLLADLKSRLSSDEFKQVRRIIAAKENYLLA